MIGRDTGLVWLLVSALVWAVHHWFPLRFESAMASTQLLRVDFEVFGRVQGVFFRKYTESEAKKVGVCGWIRNTSHKTVQGQLEGESNKVEHMKNWLRTKGSPQSSIEKGEFKNETKIDSHSFKTFSVRR